jgi:hypothetical protein
MRFIPLSACALLLALPAKADKFWFSDPATAKNAPAGSSPDCLQGVLISEDATSYHIRVVGGELVLAKKSVVKVEKDGLTLENIQKSEKDAADALALANKERTLKQELDRKERELRAVEASARHGNARPVEASAPRPEVAPPTFDPVLGVARGVSDVATQLELKRLYEETGDQSYLTDLRRLRRAH